MFQLVEETAAALYESSVPRARAAAATAGDCSSAEGGAAAPSAQPPAASAPPVGSSSQLVEAILEAELAEQSPERAQAYRRTLEKSRLDPVTRVYNRRHFDKLLATEASRARRCGSSLVALRVEFDHFAALKEQHGQRVSDAVLAAAAAALKAHVRRHDLIVRLDDGELALLLPGTALRGGLECAERLRLVLAALAVASYPHRLTASVGVALLSADEDGSLLLDRAAAALARARREGGNRVRVLLAAAPTSPAAPPAPRLTPPAPWPPARAGASR